MSIALTTLIAGAVILMDQISKYFFRGADLILIPNIVKLTGVHNTGVAFGALSSISWLLPLMTGLVTAMLLFYIVTARPGGLLAVGLALILGGAAGNLIDRVLHGYVIDFIELIIVRFAIFNIADMAITIGWVICFVSLLFWRKKAHA